MAQVACREQAEKMRQGAISGCEVVPTLRKMEKYLPIFGKGCTKLNSYRVFVDKPLSRSLCFLQSGDEIEGDDHGKSMRNLRQGTGHRQQCFPCPQQNKEALAAQPEDGPHGGRWRQHQESSSVYQMYQVGSGGQSRLIVVQ
jgi:hypothetical protein